MTISAQVFAGVPPFGLGIYVRSRMPSPGPWRWYAVDPRIGGGALARECMRRGPTFLFVNGPEEYWGPNAWRATLAMLREHARRLGTGLFGPCGILPNPEAGWGSASAAEMQAFGEGLRDAALEHRVGVVTIPSWRGFTRVAAAAGARVWWSPEFYSQSVSEAQVAGWWSRWRAVVGLRMTPTIAAFRPPNDRDQTLSTPEGYDRYLASIPRLAPGAIAWPVYGADADDDGTPDPPAYMVRALQRRYGFPFGVAFAVPALVTFATSMGAIIIAACMLAIAMLAVGLGKVG